MCRFTRGFLSPTAVMLTVALLGIGCSNNSAEVAKGFARVGVQMSALQQSDVKSGTLTVGAGTGTPTFNNIVMEMSKDSNSDWTAYVTDIPAGAGRTFHIEACDTAGRCDWQIDAGDHLYKGDATANIVAGATAQVYMLLQQIAPPNSFNNHAPVIDTLTASAAIVVPGTTVTLAVTAHDPDTASNANNKISGYVWAASCGALTNATSQTPTWTAPATDGTCSITVTVSDVCPADQPAVCSSSVTATVQIQVQTAQNGNAMVTAYPNTCPLVSCVAGQEKFRYTDAGVTDGSETDLAVTAVDSDGDDLRYAWTSNCVGGTFTSATGATTHFSSPAGQSWASCDVRVDVTDYWPGGNAPAGSGLPAARGCDNFGLLVLSATADFVFPPVISRATGPNANNQVSPGQTVLFTADVSDPQNAYPLTTVWQNIGGTGSFGTQVLYAAGDWGKKTITTLWAAPSPLASGMQIRLVVTNTKGLSVQKDFLIIPANACALAGSDGQACDTGLGLCGPGGQCLAGACVSPTPVNCNTPPDTCHVATGASCNPSTGACTYPVASVGTSCNADSSGCTQNDVCNASGTCVAGSAPTCNTSPGVCYASAGTCSSTGNNTYTCNYGTLAAGVTCTPTGTYDHCFQSYACNSAGACSQASSPVNCASSACTTGGTCNSATGTCQGGANQPNGTACAGSDVCQAYACQTGVCTGAPLCSAGQSCSGGTCADVIPHLLTVRNQTPTPGDYVGLSASPPQAVVFDTAGAIYVTGAIGSSATFFDGQPVAVAGSTDILVAKYDATTHAPAWVKLYGDASTQKPWGMTVTADGTLGVIGRLDGVINGKQNPRTYTIDVMMGLSSTDGSVKWTKMVDNGINGSLTAVAANRALNTIAVCGLLDGSQAVAGGDAPLAPVSEYRAGANNAVIALLNSTDGSVIWHRDIGGANGGTELCTAPTVDANGDVYASGQYSIDIDFGTGGTPVDSSNTGATKMWVAKFSHTDGSTLADAAFGTSAAVTPNNLLVDSTGKLFVAGSFACPAAAPLVFGATSLATQGGTDAFVVKLDPATGFTPAWAVRMGSTTSDDAKWLALAPSDDVLVTGAHSGAAASTGIANLVAGSGSPNAYLLKLKGTNGALQFAATYGDIYAQYGTRIATLGSTLAFGGNFATIGSVINFGGSTVPAVAYGAPTLTANAAAAFLVYGQLQ